MSQYSQVEDVSEQISEAVSQWESSGQDALRNLFLTRIDTLHSSPLSSITLSHALFGLLASDLEPQELADLLSSLIGGFAEDVKEERTELLGEALVDVIEIIEQEREDGEDVRPEESGMEVDGEGKKWKGAEKGLEVLQLLLVCSSLKLSRQAIDDCWQASKHLPSHIPNLLLNPQLLLTLNLHPSPHNPQALQRAYVKRNTTLFFKQSKYNLLRESSEGFSGLIVLLTGPDALLRQSPAEESDQSRKDRAKRVWAKVMGLIGYFNLSPPRVLDIVLEISSCQVAVHWRFFLDLLRCSPWGAAADTQGKGKGKAMDVRWVDEEMWSIAEAMEEGGDRVLSQVLGVKFGFYQVC